MSPTVNFSSQKSKATGSRASFFTNSSIESFKRSLDKLSKLIETNNTAGLIDFFHAVKDARDESISGKKD